MSWLGRLFRRESLERELEQELRFHVETRAAELRRSGMSEQDARRRALAEFGGVEPIKELARDARGTQWVSDIGQDVRYALRMLRANKAFSAAAVISLAIGIGANAAVFRVINSIVLRPLDVPRPNELFSIESSLAKTSRFSGPAYRRLADAGSGAELAAMTPPTDLQVLATDTSELTMSQLVSGTWFQAIGLAPSAGRLLAADDETGAEPVAVISDRLWTTKFGRSASAVGATIRVNNTACRVVGVAAPGFSGVYVGQPVDVWLPLGAQFAVHYRSNAAVDDADDEKPWLPQDGVAWLAVLGRRPASVSAAALGSALGVRYAQIAQDRAAAVSNVARRARLAGDTLTITPIPRGVSSLRTRMTPMLSVLMGMVGLVLLVACANLANLLLARGAARSREFSLRLSIGARRSRLVRQLLTESLTLAVIGGAVGLLLAWWGGVALLRMLTSASTAPTLALPIDWRVAGFGAAITLVTGVAFGLLPALRLSRPALVDAMKSGGRVVNSGRGGRVPIVKVLVAVQVAVSMLLLVGSLVFFQTFRNLMNIDAGYDRDSVVTARFDTRLAGYSEAQLPGVYARLIDAASRVPGVVSATLGRVGPATGSASTSGIQIPGVTSSDGAYFEVNEDQVGAGYIRTLGMRLLAGRDFDERDTDTSAKVAIINETMAKKWFEGTNPVGRTFNYGPDSDAVTIVGVVADARSAGLRQSVPPYAYYPLSQTPYAFVRNLYVRVAPGQVNGVIAELRRAVSAAAPEMAIREVVSLGELTERSIGNERLVSTLAAAFGVLGVLVAGLGLYGTIAYSVARRVNEIGVRLALGAAPGGVRWMVLRETIGLTLVGAAGGVLLTLPLAKAAESLVYGLSPRDPVTLAVSAGLVTIIGLIAGAVPAWRASRVNPTSALRAD